MFYMATAPMGYYGVTKGSDMRGFSGQLTGAKKSFKENYKSETFSINLPIGNNKYQKVSFRGFDPVAQMFANTANFGQMMSMMQGSIYNNIDPNDPQNNNYQSVSN